MSRLIDDHYTADLYLAAQRPDAAQRFRLLGALSRAMDMTRFIRPRNTSRFAASADIAEKYVRAAAGEV